MRRYKKKIDSGEMYYKELDPKILNSLVNEDNREIEKAKTEHKKKVNNIILAMNTVAIASILGVGIYLNKKK